MEKSKKQKNPPTAADIGLIVEAAVKKAVCAEIAPLKENVDYLMKKDSDALIIADYLKKHPHHKQRNELSNQQWINRELIKALIYALAIIAALAGVKIYGTHS